MESPTARSRPVRFAGVVAAALLAALSALPAPAAAQAGEEAAEPESPGGASALHGRVTVAETGEPLVNAVVHVLGRDRHAVADSSGEFRIGGLEPGDVSVRVEYLGAATGEKAVELEPGEAERVDFRAREAAVELTELQVEVRRRRGGRMAGFERRREQGRGDHITREDIERLNPVRTTQLIRHEAVGARIRRTRTGEYRVLLRSGVDRCPPSVFLDGVLVQGFSVNDIDPSDLEGVELYDGSVAPAQYRGTQGCGVVLLWTRTGR